VVAVMIGVDPHKGSHTAVAMGAAGEPLDELRVGASAGQAQQLLAWAAAWPERTWAIEGAAGLGHLLAQQLVAAGERVADVPPRLGARVRLLAAGAVNKNDPHDARSVAVAALRSASQREVKAGDHAAVLKVWAKRHRDLGRTRTQVACRLHAVLCELIPGGVLKRITAAHAAGLLEHITPPGAVEAARCELATAFIEDLRRTGAQMRDAKNKLTAAVRASSTTVTEVFGAGPVVAATVIGAVRDVSRFADRDHFAAYNGTAPIEVSSGPPQDLPAVAAREPAAQPRHPHGRGHPDQPPPQRRPRLLRAQASRGQDPQRGAPFPETAGQRRHLRPPPGRRPPGRGKAHAERAREGNGGTTQSPARPAHTPTTGSSAKPLPGPPPPYDPVTDAGPEGAT
jgi:transposase